MRPNNRFRKLQTLLVLFVTLGLIAAGCTGGGGKTASEPVTPTKESASLKAIFRASIPALSSIPLIGKYATNLDLSPERQLETDGGTKETAIAGAAQYNLFPSEQVKETTNPETKMVKKSYSYAVNNETTVLKKADGTEYVRGPAEYKVTINPLSLLDKPLVVATIIIPGLNCAVECVSDIWRIRKADKVDSNGKVTASSLALDSVAHEPSEAGEVPPAEVLDESDLDDMFSDEPAPTTTTAPPTTTTAPPTTAPPTESDPVNASIDLRIDEVNIPAGAVDYVKGKLEAIQYTSLPQFVQKRLTEARFNTIKDKLKSVTVAQAANVMSKILQAMLGNDPMAFTMDKTIAQIARPEGSTTQPFAQFNAVSQLNLPLFGTMSFRVELQPFKMKNVSGK